MADYKQINIDNSSKSAVKTGKWSNPGASFYDQLLNSYSCEGKLPDGPDEMKQKIKDGTYVQWDGMLKEAYLVAPIKDIKNSPYGVTPFSRSGCKYPHHVIKDGKLVLSVPGVKAAYARACQMKECEGEVKKHILKHMEELGLKSQFHHGQLYWNEQADAMDRMEKNFQDIYESIKGKTGLDLASLENFNESVLEGENNSVTTSDIFDEIGKTPVEICNWMKENISYDNTISGWKLRTPAELYKDKMGNCHDQSYFLTCMLHSLGYVNGQLFFVEYKEDSDIGGNTHTLTWYRDKLKQIFWVENAWEDQAGIHGPYADIADLKSDILTIYENDNDINSHKFDGIVFSTSSNYRTGMSLGEYVESWALEDNHVFTKEEAINEAMDFLDSFINDAVFRESVNAPKTKEYKDIETPEELLKWMDCIQYGWLDRKGVLNGTGDQDDTSIFYKEYKLQSPSKLRETKVGVCWDQTELEREWFSKHNYDFAVIYIELQDGDDRPSHTFLIYRTDVDNPNGPKCAWFEHSWHNNKGIHIYDTAKECITDVIRRQQRFAKDTNSIVMCKKLSKGLKNGTKCQEFMDYAHSQPDIDLADIQSDEIFSESTEIDFLSESIITPDFLEELAFDINEDEVIKRNEELIHTEAYSLDNLPDTMYFASPNAISGKTISAKAPRGLFLTPYLGIASMFVVDRHRLLGEYINGILAKNGRELYKLNANISYKEWEYDSGDLQNPLKTVSMYHNIPDFKEVMKGSSTGFIYQIDVSKVKSELITYVTNNPDREVIYKGDAKLPILDHMVHSISWSLSYKPGSWKGSFESKVKSKEVKESVMYESGIVEGQGIIGDDLDWITNYLMEEGEVDQTPKKKKEKADMKQDSGKNGARRKQLYIEFIEWAKEFNPKNTFGSIFDKDAFEVSYPFVPNDMRYFYRLANPLLCVLDGDLTFFQVSELRKLNEENPDMESLLIFAATDNDMRVFNTSDNKIYKAAEDENGKLELKEVLGDTFDLYIQNMIGKGDILNGPIKETK